MISKPLKDSKVLVIGATSMVGQAIAKTFADEGSSVTVTGRDKKKLSEIKRNLGKNAATAVLDLGSSKALKEELPALKKKLGSFDHLVFTVAPPVTPVGVADNGFAKELKTHMDVTVLGFTKVFEALGEKMVRPGGSITTVLTEYVIGAPPEKTAAYVSAKTALQTIMVAMATELGPQGLRCNNVAPGMINTPYSSHIPVRLKQIEEARNPMRRLCTPEDVARAVKFLASPDAAFINGVTLPVNGGSRVG